MNHSAPLDALTTQQVGHLRHFENLSLQPANDWSLMKGIGTGQDDFGAYRFQLAYMAYALAITHVHRLPAAPGAFKPIFERLIAKLLLPETWLYWRDVSRGGSIFNAHLKDQYIEEWDPVVRDNIMYSAYVQSLTLLYNVLFDDDRYAQPDAITFEHWSYFWGGDGHRFHYDQNSLNEHLYWKMVESGYLGVACEPNCIFQICNQPAILGFRMNDLLTGGNLAEEVTRGYEQAWTQFGRLGDNGHYHVMLSEDTRTVRPNLAQAPWVDAWCGALMNMWNGDFVRAHYPQQLADLLLQEPDGTLSVKSAPRPPINGHVVLNDDSDFGWIAAWASEMGDEETLRGLLHHADRHMAPRWRDGGLYYPRNDVAVDAAGHRTLVEPMTGNVLLGYARLNVRDGLQGIYRGPWVRTHFKEPAIIEVGGGIDILQARFEPASHSLLFTLQVRADHPVSEAWVVLGRIDGRGRWTLLFDSQIVAYGDAVKLSISGPVQLRRTDAGLELRWSGSRIQPMRLIFANDCIDGPPA
ncbi:hypothetical protein ASG75_10865 [Rhodanobacter sp. Soil772]|uniref:linalool dehydratase/isomerase domain-containing protein n=1 Tax=Rhodanobacter sp. Soil772 TaxID=1736406 RepID=UPI000701346A|nr:hypothetical protein [Rhodanobacter sp. Soil772]KRE86027.1 hypothetical protein ASG75_10865 [Rhodanobacter sp. Soil772]